MTHVVVIGAGINGVATAIWLRRAGADVTLVDKGAPGQGTSYGNAGLLAAAAVVPVTVPGLIRKAPGYVMDRNFPLFLRWSYLPRLMPFLVRYLAHANDRDTRRIAQALQGILADSVEQHLALTDGLDTARAFIRKCDYAFAYRDRTAYEADGYVWKLRHELGFTPRLIEGAEVADFDPAYGPEFNCLAVLPDHGSITDPGGYVAALADAAGAMGCQILQAEVSDLTLRGGKIAAVETTAGAIDCDHAVITTGVWSGPLMRKLGLKIPLESERGYHLMLKGAKGGPKVPTMITTGKFVATPMNEGLRCAGVVEFGGLKAGPSDAPLDLLRKQVRHAFPDLSYEVEETWMGHRPATSDSLPVIGEVGATGVYAGFGHQHIGLTAGAKTGRLLAGLIMGARTNLDLTPYSAHRFK